MAKIFPIYKKIIQQVTGSTSGFIASVILWGIKLTNQLQLLAAETWVGIKITQYIQARAEVNTGVQSFKPTVDGETSTTTNVGALISNFIADRISINTGYAIIASIRSHAGTAINAGVQTALKGFVGVMDAIPINAAAQISAVIKSYLYPQKPAVNVVQVTYDLVSRKGAATATEANGPCGRQDFDTPANAVGIHDGTVCTCSGNLLAARCGRLNTTFSAQFGKDALTITQVNLHFYYQVTRLLSATATGGYTLAGDTQLFSDSASVNYLTTPRTFDITSAIAGSWTNVTNLKAYVIADLAALAVNDAVAVDAIELEVIATLTEAV